MNKQDILKAMRAGYGLYLCGQRTALVKPDGNRIGVTYKSGWAARCALSNAEITIDKKGVYWIILDDDGDDAIERAAQIAQEK